MIDVKTINELIHPYITPTAVLGMSLAIVQRDEVIYANGFGVTSAEDGGLPVTPQTLFAVGSTSKIITALLIMRLVEQGVLDLDRPVVDYLPGYTFTDNPAWGNGSLCATSSAIPPGWPVAIGNGDRATSMHCGAGFGRRWLILPCWPNLAAPSTTAMVPAWPPMSPKR
ncbi:MAG: serine hydrolase domain-containing protein [Caldilineaceae bacterium]